MDPQILLTLAVVLAFSTFALLERVLPGYHYPQRPRWVARGIAWFGIAFLVGAVVPLWTDTWLSEHALLDLSGWGLWGVIPAAIGYQLLGYAWHRTLHAVGPLWRLHQTHHSSERVDIWSALRFHPLDVAGWTVLVSVSSIFLFGVALEAALLNAFLASVMAWFGHTNVKTPRWLGYLVARPESHALHHARGLHRKNYADLPLVDMLFGTFQNPDVAPAQAGFWDGASEQTAALLLGRDVAEQRARDMEPQTLQA